MFISQKFDVKHWSQQSKLTSGNALTKELPCTFLSMRHLAISNTKSDLYKIICHTLDKIIKAINHKIPNKLSLYKDKPDDIKYLGTWSFYPQDTDQASNKFSVRNNISLFL